MYFREDVSAFMRFARTFPVWKTSAKFRRDYGMVIEDICYLRSMCMQSLSLLTLEAGAELEGVGCVWVMIAANYLMGHSFSFIVQGFRHFGEHRTLRSAVRLDNAQSVRDGLWRTSIKSSSSLSSIVFLLIARISKPNLQIATQSPITLRI